MIARKYFWLALTWGLIMVFLVPPLEAPDEDGHYLRAVSISEGHYWCRNSQVEVSAQAANFVKFMEVDRIRIHPEQKFNWQSLLSYKDTSATGTVFVNSVLCPMNSLTHFPAAAILGISRTFGANLLESFYLARIFNLLIALFLMTIAIKIAPLGKWILVAVGLLPMTMQQFGSLSYDALLLPTFWIFSALALKIAQTPNPSSKNKFLCTLLALPLVVIKPAYATILLFGLFCWGKGKKSIIAAIFLIFSAVFIQSQVWGGVSSLAITKPGLQAKIGMFIHRPWVVPAIVLNTLRFPDRDFDLYIQMLGKLGYTDYYLSGWVYVVATAVLILGVLGSGSQIVISPQIKKTIWLIFILTIFSVFTYLYFLDTPMSRKVLTVRGVQGRYLLPVMYWFLVSLKRLKPQNISKAVILSWILLVIGTAQAVITRYY
jgi:uncharacterized membrane protein